MKTTEEIKQIIERHIANYDKSIAEQEESIREIYAEGRHTNVDPERSAIERYKQRRFALEVILEEIAS